MQALRFLGMRTGVASQGRPTCRGFPTANGPPTPKAPARTPSSPNSQDLSRYAFASGEGTT